MISVRKAGLFLLLLCWGSPPPAFSRSEPAAHPPVRVAVSILPQAWFVEQIGGDRVTVQVMVGPGHSPATYEPTPRQMSALQDADFFLCAGVPFERGLLPKLSALPDGPPLAGRRPELPAPETVRRNTGDEDDPGHGHGHDHGEDETLDPHDWLSPAGAAALADTVLAVLVRFDPAGRTQYEARHRHLQAELARAADRAREQLAPFAGSAIFVFHPAYGHFAAAYGLRQVAVEAGGREPGARHLAKVIEQARRSGARAIVVQPQFSRRSAEAVARAVNAGIVELDPLARDYLANLQDMTRKLVAILGPTLGGKQ